LPELSIRPASDADRPALWAILEPVIRAGETFALPRAMTEAEAHANWCAPDRQVFVAVDAGQVVGSYYLKPNQPGGGAHVANAGYMVAGPASGRGVARAMGLHSLATARAQGYRAVQFNFVVSTNAPAVHLWQSIGFQIVGRVPDAYHHATLGYVDIFVMHKSLI